MVYNREVALNLLGCICNNLHLIRDRNYMINQNDFDDLFHKLIFGVVQNLALENDIVEVDGFTIGTYLKKYPVEYEKFKASNGIEFVTNIKNMANNTSFEYSYKMLKKFSLLRRYQSIGMDISDIYDPQSLDVRKIEEQTKKIEKTSIEKIKQHFKAKMIEVDMEFQTRGDSYSFRAGEGVEDLLIRCKQKQQWGATFQSKLFNAIFGGMVGSKLMIRSAGTGGSKTRQSIGDMCNISCSARYNPRSNQWEYREIVEETLFISTELVEDEIHLIMLSNIAGVPEEKIKYGQTNAEEDVRLEKAAAIMKNSKMYIEYTSNFSIGEIESIIERNIIRNNTKYIFFDYIQVTSNLAQELIGLFGYVLREDQMLNQLSTALKNIANKYNVFILTSTQLNRSYKTDGYADATWLRGSQAVLDKADYGVITMKATKADLDKLQPILENRFGGIKPTHGHHVIKNRGGKWVGVILWVVMDLDTVNVWDGVVDGFVTTQDFELIKTITPITLE